MKRAHQPESMGTLRLVPANATTGMRKPVRNDQNLAISLVDACFAHPTGLHGSPEILFRPSPGLLRRVVRLGIDIGKNSFHLWGVNEQDERVVKRKVRRCVLLREVANLPACLIGMEACGGAHHSDARRRWIKRLVRERGHNRAMVAVANKNARISWALLTRQEAYRFATGT